jgi:hypothetical protein
MGLQEDRDGMEGVLQFHAGDTAFVVYPSDYAGSNKATALTWVVGDQLEKVVQALKGKGVEFEHYELPDTVRKGDIHESGPIRNAWFKDPDGNIHALSNVG